MRRLRDIWTWGEIHHAIPRTAGVSIHFINNDVVEDTGSDWMVTRDGKEYYFGESGELVDFIFTNTPDITDVHFFCDSKISL